MNDKMTVMAVDPGTGTGLAWATFRRGVGAVEAVKLSWADENWAVGDTEFVDCHDEDRGVERICEVLWFVEPDVLVIEDFVLYPPEVVRGRGGWSMDRAGLSPVRITAKIEWEIHRMLGVGGLEVVKQMPAVRTVVNKDRMKRWGIWRTPLMGGGKDVVAAVQHLVVYGRGIKWDGRDGRDDGDGGKEWGYG
jgi:hypothetical protein